MSAPIQLRNDSHQGLLFLEWPDGQQQALAHALLREHCQCAFCRARRLRGETISADPDLRLTALHAQGYGLQLVFSDGHDRGIYPWTLLVEIAGLPGQSPLSP